MNRKTVRIYIGSLIFIFVVPSVIFAASFDCEKATTEVEKLICSDDLLSSLDRLLSTAYRIALKRTDNEKQLIHSQKQWLKYERNACRDTECIKEAYVTRIKELRLSSQVIVKSRPSNRGASQTNNPSKKLKSQVTELPEKPKLIETEPQTELTTDSSNNNIEAGSIGKNPKVTIFYYDEDYRPVVKLEKLGPISDGLRAILAMYALQNGAGCSGGHENISCSFTNALSVGRQCSKEHIDLVLTWFGKSIPKMSGYGDWIYTRGDFKSICYDTPDSATFQRVWDTIRVRLSGNHVIIDAHGSWLARDKSGSFRYITEYRINKSTVTVISHKEVPVEK